MYFRLSEKDQKVRGGGCGRTGELRESAGPSAHYRTLRRGLLVGSGQYRVQIPGEYIDRIGHIAGWNSGVLFLAGEE